MQRFRLYVHIGKQFDIDIQAARPEADFVRLHRTEKLIVLDLRPLPLFEHVNLRAQYGKRRSQLVGRTGREASLHRERLAQLAGHLIERPHKLLDLSPTPLDLDGLREGSQLHLAHSCRELLYGLGVAPCHEVCRTTADDDHEGQDDEGVRQYRPLDAVRVKLDGKSPLLRGLQGGNLEHDRSRVVDEQGERDAAADEKANHEEGEPRSQ